MGHNNAVVEPNEVVVADPRNTAGRDRETERRPLVMILIRYNGLLYSIFSRQ